MSRFLQKPVILLVSQQLSAIAWVRRALGSSVHLLEASGLGEAIEFVRQTTVDVIIIDGALENPFDISDKIKQKLLKRTAPILLITGKLKRDYRQAAFLKGITGFLSDDYDTNELLIAIKDSLQSMQSEEKIVDLSLLIPIPTAQGSDLEGRVNRKRKLCLIELDQMPIFEQLQLEERLLRTSKENICLLSWGSPPSIVLGISGKLEEHLDVKKLRQKPVPVVRRFSGGGTVFIDENTLFVTLIISDPMLVPHFPEPILRWGEELFQKSWGIPKFHLIENDYCIGDLKCGGNAQYIQRGRWLHHTSFLWDYSKENMDYLLMPPKKPIYRKARSHGEFLCKLKDYGRAKEWLFSQLKQQLAEMFEIEKIDPTDIPVADHRMSVMKIDL